MSPDITFESLFRVLATAATFLTGRVPLSQLVLLVIVRKMSWQPAEGLVFGPLLEDRSPYQWLSAPCSSVVPAFPISN